MRKTALILCPILLFLAIPSAYGDDRSVRPGYEARKTALVLCPILFLLADRSACGDGGSVRASYKARTGDAALDRTLAKLNARTRGPDLSEFVSDVSLSYNIPGTEIEDLLYRVKMTPADVYMTVGLASIIKRPINVVVGEYKANKGKGWGVIAKRLGIRPCSREFHALKKGGAVQLAKAKGKGKAEKKYGKDKKHKKK